MCEHSQFCGDSSVFSVSQCNTSLYLCISQELQCDGSPDCLPGDLSDELGCRLPYIMVTTGSLVLGLVALASSACVWQHHSRMADTGMTRYKQDLVRRKDKVKARNFENKRNKWVSLCNKNRSRFLFFSRYLGLSQARALQWTLKN